MKNMRLVAIYLGLIVLVMPCLADFGIVDVSRFNGGPTGFIYTKVAGSRVELRSFNDNPRDHLRFSYKCALVSDQEGLKRALNDVLSNKAGSHGIAFSTGDIPYGNHILKCVVNWYDHHKGPLQCIKEGNCKDKFTQMSKEQFNHAGRPLSNKTFGTKCDFGYNPYFSDHISGDLSRFDWKPYLNSCRRDFPCTCDVFAITLNNLCPCTYEEETPIIVTYDFPFYAAPAYEITLHAETNLRNGEKAFSHINESGQEVSWKSGQKIHIPSKTLSSNCIGKPCGGTNAYIPNPDFNALANQFKELVIRTNEEVNINVESSANRINGRRLTSFGGSINQINFLAIDGKSIESAVKSGDAKSKVERIGAASSRLSFARKNMIVLSGDMNASNACKKSELYPNSNKAGAVTFNDVEPLNNLAYMDVMLNNGSGKTSFKLHFRDVTKGVLRFSYLDLNTFNRVKEEQDKGRCGFSAGPCPYPPLVEFNIPFTVVPDSFDIKLGLRPNLNAGAAQSQFIYMGRGGGHLELKARLNKPKLATSLNYSHMCASMDMGIHLGKDNNAKWVGLGTGGLDLSVGEGGISAAKFNGGEFKSGTELVYLPTKKGGDMLVFSSSNVENPAHFNYADLYFTNVEVRQQWPRYRTKIDVAAIRPRLNLIDGDNSADASVLPVTRAYYELYCGIKPRESSNECDEVAFAMLKEKLGERLERSPTGANWLTSGELLPRLSPDNVSIEGGGIKLKEIKGRDYYDQLIYESTGNGSMLGRHKVRVKVGGALDYPQYMLYNPYYENGSWGVNGYFDVYPPTSGAARSQGASIINPSKGKSRLFSGDQ